MNAADLKEATEIVSSIKWLERALQSTLIQAQTATLTLLQQSDRTNAAENYSISLAAREAAHRVMRREWELRLADRKRRAAQIGLNLGDGK